MLGTPLHVVVAWGIGVVFLVVGFVQEQGGLVQVLVQIGIFGFACYISLFVGVPVAPGILWALESSSNRRSTNAGAAVITVIVTVALAVVIRFGVFYDGMRSEGDLDGVGTALTAGVGAVVLLVPFVMLWWRKGST